jgi:hypothetical protein
MAKLTKVDREACERAIVLTLAERDKGRVEQVRDMLATRPREEVGRFCAYHRQNLVLRPRPWQPVPACDYVDINDRDGEAGPVTGRAAAAHLLRRLLESNLSRYEPDPLAALEQAESTRRDERVVGGKPDRAQPPSSQPEPQ